MSHPFDVPGKNAPSPLRKNQSTVFYRQTVVFYKLFTDWL